jgi:hypothetical protein
VALAPEQFPRALELDHANGTARADPGHQSPDRRVGTRMCIRFAVVGLAASFIRARSNDRYPNQPGYPT